MDASPDVLAETVRAKRVAIDNDLELLRVRLQQADPRRNGNAWQLTKKALPVAACAAALWLWTTRRRNVRSLDQLLVHELTDLYHAERQTLPALDRMCAQASNDDLREALTLHRAETESHVERLVRVFRSIGARPARGSRSSAISGIVADGERLLGRKVDPQVRDAWLIATAQRIEHVEIAAYGTARTRAQKLGYTFAAELLQEALAEEKTADEKLTRIAERLVNPLSIRLAPQ
jgi:ferritin-like metal-binding protein YciE